MEVELAKALEIAGEKRENRTNYRKEKSRYLRSYCNDFDFILLSPNSDTFFLSIHLKKLIHLTVHQHLLIQVPEIYIPYINIC